MLVVFSPLAEADLEDIESAMFMDSPQYALRFMRELREHCNRISQFPQSCPLREELGVGIRVLVHERYLLFYRERNNQLRIERIIYGSRDLGNIDIF
jgi:toxin ParE1/3/4